MKLTVLLFIGCLTYPLSIWAQESYYCPQNHGYIKIGMTTEQVINACGPPLSKRQSGIRVTQRVPVTQLLYTNLNQGSPWGWGGTTNLYQAWSMPSGSKGIGLQIDLINKKVTNIKINGSDSNAASICSGGSIQVGDEESMVYQSCGNPAMVNNTYINQPIPSNEKPEVWVYQASQYQQPISLTIVNGKLQSIN